MLRKLYLILILVLSFSAHLWGATYYVSKTGNDTNAGTSWATAWSTVDKVNSTLVGGDTVFFGTGTWYNSKITPPANSNANDRTCYADSAFVPNHPAHIYGGTLITNWILHSGSVYKARYVPTGYLGTKECDVLGQNDSLLIPGSAVPTSAGRFYHNVSTDTIYAWCWGGGDPDGYTMIGSSKEVVRLTGGTQNHTIFWGLDISYGKGACILISDNVDYLYIDHCKIRFAGYGADGNAACIRFYAIPSDSSQNGHYCRVRACSLSTAYEMPGGNNAWIICIYGQSYLTVDSNFIWGHSRAGIVQKGNNTYMIGNKYLFNTIDARLMSYAGIIIMSREYKDTIAGNTIYGNIATTPMGIQHEAVPSSYGYTAYLNNTIYNIKSKCFDIGASGTPGDGNIWKYNICSQLGNADNEIVNHSTAAKLSLDSNMYYDDHSSFYCNGTTYNWHNWKVAGFDVNSDSGVNPNFNNASIYDFSRPSSSTEMNLTYGGRTWTLYGAWQPSIGASAPHISLSTQSLTFNAVQNDPLPSPHTFTITNSGGGTLNYSISDNATWLGESPTSGNSNSDIITVSVNTSNFTPGTYNATITISSSNADNSPQVVSVAYIIASQTLTPPVPISPPNGGTIEDTSATLKIRNGRDSLGAMLLHFFQIDSAVSFDSPRLKQSSELALSHSDDTTTEWPVQGLTRGRRYFWRAFAYTNSNPSYYSTPCSVSNFWIRPQGVAKAIVDIHVSPNPFKPSRGDPYITFHNIPLNSTIRIFTVSGELVKTFDNTQQADVVWDVKNEDQRNLASGSYYYWVYNGGKVVRSDKISVIR